MTALLEELDRIEKLSANVAEAQSDDFGHSVTACMEWQVSQISKLDENTTKLIEALRIAVGALENVTLCQTKTVGAEEVLLSDAEALDQIDGIANDALAKMNEVVK